MPRYFLFALVLCTAVSHASAQTVYGTLSGRVLDPSRAPLADAIVTAIDIATNAPSVASTAADGTFHFTRLTPASYRVTIEKAGFRQQVHDAVSVTVNEQVVIESVLELGAIEDSIVVEGRPPLVQAKSAEVSGLIDQK
ncbi:MAG: carboxypeptidase-like regulatory domain-containing protein, partial [Vicinamibacterales bacterium]